MSRNPSWLVKRFYDTEKFSRMKKILNQFNLKTVCQEALCPNMSECFSGGRVTFLILGNRCTRSCNFCFVKQGEIKFNPGAEIENIVKIVEKLGLRHVVITSVTRDDLSDKGAGHFAGVVKAIRELNSDITIETLIPDFGADKELIGMVCKSGIDILNHNIETVPRLYPRVRPQADYLVSLNVLKIAQNFGSLTKSGLMLGLGEKESELIAVFEDLRKSNVDILTVGQYLRPGKNKLEVKDFISPEKFEFYRKTAYNMGFKYVSSAPFVRSSYAAEETIARINHTYGYR